MSSRRDPSAPPPPRTGVHSLVWAIGAFGLLIVLALVPSLVGDARFEVEDAAHQEDQMLQGMPAGEDYPDCSEYGLAEDDPRSEPKPLYVSAPSGSPHAPTVDGVNLDQHFSSGGMSGRYHVFARDIDYSKPVGLVVRLHGDGAEEYAKPWGMLNCMAQVAASYNAILVVPLTPDPAKDLTWWKEMDENQPWLMDLVQRQLPGTYPIDPSRVWWMGYSGGAEMLSYGVVPDHLDAVTGGAIMVGGGGAPRYASVKPSAEQAQDTRLYWLVGAQDDGTDPREPFDARTAAVEGSAWYERVGFAGVRLNILNGRDHLNVPQVSLLDQILSAHAR
ncbi:hypothetical protein NBM05_10505 [Rothia sp. AR01]|uniref:Uncharacterized protein n=1 Tax=Rothia santali TaxID=2949643 RepID=A0A9X2HDR7_9MICC|nr:hypothetical protein [Rothia santali]MCP3426420.1 hypothetical protein [Rothia santali]